MPIKNIGVVGAGMMGAEIALSFALAGYETAMADVTAEIAENGRKKQVSLLENRVKKGKLSKGEAERTIARVSATCDYGDLKHCDLVIEAVPENLEIKFETYKKLDAVCAQSCIIASNTSSISIAKLASVVTRERAKRFIGTHFNSPASVMKLVEVIPAILTDEQTVAEVTETLNDIGKETVLVKDVTGFALNRLFHIFYLEACRLVEEGVCSVEDVDKICVHGLGHPMGIFKLLDILGHDLSASVDEILFDAYGERFRPSAHMRRLIDSGMHGRKTGEGFYKYDAKA
ncbi:MAG: 3-hydroxyacyl-CoA dehydrogenase family protein [Clostridiales Family XIII bacterium]|jgi:3-hydroxybutyryl-CoA dehydrogenase|nr:3-hydroxyacyl-CoA dehydrogenase family protein [Clostridiales Family XIII bacterium]